MSLRLFLRTFFRTRSCKAARLLTTTKKGVVHLYLKNKGLSLKFRTGTSDASLIRKILLKNERYCSYYIPGSINLAVILDIGANIGVSALYFKRRYPNAKIYCFEPAPENIELLKENVAKFKDIIVIGKALYNNDGFHTYYFSGNENNFGGGTLKEIGHNPNKKYMIETISYPKASLEYGIGDMVDIIKIDTEGSEYEILTNIPENVIKNVSYIIGELHGINDFETLAYLSEWFNIGLEKKTSKTIFNFLAVNKNIKK